MTTASTQSSTMSALTTSLASSSTFAPPSNSTQAMSLGAPSQEKLTRNNFLMWKAIVLPQIKGAQMDHHLDPTS
uniref:Retrotransposon Copia-like N-terminal domain-containing protein n=1 Tax=Triticum urartu TaxID=4572 RepID=A0A8R7PLU8_TRIUA